MVSLLGSLFFIFIFLHSALGSIDDILSYYETLHHDTFKHHINRRDLYSQYPVERSVEFNSHGRNFKLVLHRNTSVLSSDFKLTVHGKESKSVSINTDIYRGYLADDPGSSVSAYWDGNNDLTASISTKSDIFVVEPSWRHLPHSQDYTSISYKWSDMKAEKDAGRFCDTSNTDLHYHSNDGGDRQKRNIRNSSKKTCQVLLVADYRFYKEIGRKDYETTARYMILVADRVNELFRSHEFADCGSGFGIELKEIVIHEMGDGGDHFNNPNKQWSSTDKFLTYFSRQGDYSMVCLAHLFTAISFSSGVVGLANVAPYTDYENGGICSQKKGRDGRYNNTGWTTFLGRNGERLVSLQSFLVVAHEFGHGWGSQHDRDEGCLPDARNGGSFLMHASSVSGLETNNRFFSSCSKKEICKSLRARADMCFQERSTTKCGNYILEKNEDCDEGLASLKSDSPTTCCPQCKLAPHAKCSKLDLCCEDNCQISSKWRNCSHGNETSECVSVTYCNGINSTCPESEALPYGTPCNNNNGYCINKECKSACEYNNLNNCECDTEQDSCKVCCQDMKNSSANNSCTPFRYGNDSSEYRNVTDGTPCRKGRCNNGVCERVTDISVAFAWNFINIQSIGEFVKFMRNNIVLSVIVVSLLVWIPCSCFVWSIDRKREREESRRILWFSSTNDLLIPLGGNAKIISVSKTIDRRRRPQQQKGVLYKR